jgi:ferric hydroxamate transport system ATP-binding protein
VTGSVPSPTKDSESLYSLHGAGFVIGERALLQPLDLTLQPHRLYGLIGPNGSGKSTLVKLLARQLAASSGSINYCGKPIATWRARDFARQVGYLPQFTPPTDGLLVEELVALGRYPWHGALGRLSTTDRDKIDEAVALTHLQSFRRRAVDRLSGGERQRVWLAMLLAQDATCLLLDEPTSALDIAHQIEVLAVVRELTRHKAMTTLVVLHDVNMAARYCDEILALGNGHVIARGTPDEIMRSPTLETIYGLQMGIMHRPDDGPPIGYAL